MRANFVMSGVAMGLRRNLLMTVALVLTTAVSLTFVAASILTGIEINRFQTQYEGQLNVSIYLCNSTPTKQCNHAVTSSEQDALLSALHSDPRVAGVDYGSVDQAYKNGLATLDPAEAQFLQVGDLPSSFTVKLKNIARDYGPIAKTYASSPGVDQIQNEDESLKTILRLFSGALLAAIVTAAVVLACAIILIAITIQVAAAQRRNETSIMRLVGASRWMTQLPFILEAVIGAAIGGLAAVAATWFGKWYLLSEIFRTQVDRQVLPNLGVNDVLIAGGASLIAGILLAGLTAYVTLRMYVRL